jgi:hypothetical protein
MRVDWTRSSASFVHLPSSREHRCKAHDEFRARLEHTGAVGSSEDAKPINAQMLYSYPFSVCLLHYGSYSDAKSSR